MTDTLDALNALNAAARRTVDAFMECYVQHDAEAVKDLLAENATFKGVFSGGLLRGRKDITAHYRQSFRGVLSKGAVRFPRVEVEGQQVTLYWEVEGPGGGTLHILQGHSILVLNQDSLIQSIETVWDPKTVLAWKISE
ncbi:MAG TPA: nuclear transport factor 2 family protein [Geothrix sp.]|nr:nuclear transport factor 2 family protein [Geothrix sp.]